MLETLEILIEADSRGIETTLKKAGTAVQNFIQNINDEKVNWNGILTGTFSTAVLSSIASIFATSISSALGFQNAITNVSNNTADQMAAGTGSMTNSILDLASQTGQSAVDTATAFELFNKIFNNTADAETATADASKLAFAAHMSLQDVMSILLPLFDQWGVTTLPQAEQAMTGLANAAGDGKFSLQELIQTITSSGSTLKNNTDITTTALQLQEFSKQSGVTKQDVVNDFGELVKAMQEPSGTLTILAGGMTSLGNIIKGEGVMGAINKLGTTVTNLGGFVASSMGVSTDKFISFGKATDAVSKEVETNAAAIAKNLKSLSELQNLNTTDTQKFEIAWNNLMTTLSKDVGIPVLDKIVTPAIDYLNSLISNPKQTVSETLAGFGAILDDLGPIPKGNSFLGGSKGTIDNTRNMSMNVVVNAKTTSTAKSIATSVSQSLNNASYGIQ